MTEAQTETMKVDKRIVSFIQSQSVLTLATSAYNIPYCAPCFYAYSENANALVFKSSAETNHIVQGVENQHVAGAVLPDKLVTGKVKGIQFSGTLDKVDAAIQDDLQKVYYKKYPFALAMGGELWAIKLSWIKFTDNTLGFGTKVIWGERG